MLSIQMWLRFLERNRLLEGIAMAPVTMHDVATLAGVSVASVSRVLAGRPGVGLTKQKAVLEACAELDYQYDGVAAALRSGSTSSVGILVPDITNPFFPAVVQAAEHELAQGELDIVFCDAANDVDVETLRLRTLLRRRVDALLVCPVHTERSVPALRAAARSTRLVQLDRCAVDGLDFVGVDQGAGVAQLIAHIAERGAHDAVFVGATPGMSTIVERVSAFERAAPASGLTHETVSVTFPDREHGRAWARAAIDAGRLPDAVVCANDELAAGVLLELRARGVGAPADVLVTGYDDVPFAQLLGLTTIRQPLQDLGREAARLLRQGSSASRRVLLQPSLVVRETTAPPERGRE